MAPAAPKNRLGIISPGIGKLSAGIVCLGIGVGALMMKNEAFGQSLLIMGLMFGAWGGFSVYRGINAPVKNVACPQCGQKNEILSDVREFACSSCGKPVKLVRKAGAPKS